MAEPNLRRQWRHIHGERWHRAKAVKKRTEVETPWGIAMAEAGTYILTDKESGEQVIATLEDLLEHWTNEPRPKPEPKEFVMHPGAPADPNPPKFPGMDDYAA